jgi:hypothetical protein
MRIIGKHNAPHADLVPTDRSLKTEQRLTSETNRKVNVTDEPMLKPNIGDFVSLGSIVEDRAGTICLLCKPDLNN